MLAGSLSEEEIGSIWPHAIIKHVLPVEAPCTFLKNASRNTNPAAGAFLGVLWSRAGSEIAPQRGFERGSWGVLGGFLGVPGGPWALLGLLRGPGVASGGSQEPPGSPWEPRKGLPGASWAPPGRLPKASWASPKWLPAPHPLPSFHQACKEMSFWILEGFPAAC